MKLQILALLWMRKEKEGRKRKLNRSQGKWKDRKKGKEKKTEEAHVSRS
jgi:hypothetical protein